MALIARELLFGEFVFQAAQNFGGGVFAAQAEGQAESQGQHAHESGNQCVDDRRSHAQLGQDGKNRENVDGALNDGTQHFAVFDLQLPDR